MGSGGGFTSGAGMGGGGSFLGTAAAAAAGMVGGSLLLGSIRSMMGGNHHGFGDAGAMGGQAGQQQNPWTDQSGSSLARDAGINDIGSSSGNRADENSRAGLFDTASNDDDAMTTWISIRTISTVTETATPPEGFGHARTKRPPDRAAV